MKNFLDNFFLFERSIAVYLINPQHSIKANHNSGFSQMLHKDTGVK